MGLGQKHYEFDVARHGAATKMQALYDEYMDDLYDIQANNQWWGIVGDAFSMFGQPIIGEIVTGVGTYINSAKIDALEDLNQQFGSQFRYTGELEESEYYSGADDAAAELQASMWSSLIKSVATTAAYHGKDDIMADFTSKKEWVGGAVETVKEGVGDIAEGIGNLELPEFELPNLTLPEIPSLGSFLPDPNEIDIPNPFGESKPSWWIF